MANVTLWYSTWNINLNHALNSDVMSKFITLSECDYSME